MKKRKTSRCCQCFKGRGLSFKQKLKRKTKRKGKGMYLKPYRNL